MGINLRALPKFFSRQTAGTLALVDYQDGKNAALSLGGAQGLILRAKSKQVQLSKTFKEFYMQQHKNKAFTILVSISLIFLIVLTGCSTMQTLPQNYHKLEWSERSKQLNNIQEWSINGSISIIYAETKDIASYHWQQKKDVYSIEVSSPLNLIHFNLYGNKNKITLQQSTYRIYTANNPEQLLRQYIGWNIPVSNLVYWVRGIPAPHSAYTSQLDQYNHLSVLKQQGWTIHYSNYTVLDNIDLPTTISLEKSHIKIKIIAKNWLITSTL